MPKTKIKIPLNKRYEISLRESVTNRKEYYLSKLEVISNAVYKRGNINLINRFETRINGIYKTFSGNLEKKVKYFKPRKTQKKSGVESPHKRLSQKKYNELRDRGVSHENIGLSKYQLMYKPQVYAMVYANRKKR